MKTQVGLGCLISLIPLALGLPLNESSFSENDTIQRDIAIIGGGSSGTHAAIRLRDLGHTVVVIEKEGELGGNVQTTTVASGVRVNYGVSNFQNLTVVQDFFSRFDIPLVRYEQPGIGDIYADFATGQEIPAGTLPAPDFTAYLAEIAKYPYLEGSWDLPDPVPEDLLIPFGQFVEKYNLQDVAYTIAAFAIGNGNIFARPTIYILKVVSEAYVRAIVFGEGVAPVTYDTQSLFEMALTELGPDALLSSTVCSASRSDSGVELVVETPDGRKLIKANKLLVTAPPKIENLEPLGLDATEQGIFSKFESKAFYIALLNDTGLETGYRYYNADPNANATYHVPELPTLQFIWATKDNDTYWAWFTSPTEMSEAEVKSHILADFQTLSPGSNPQFVAYASATPSGVGVTADDIRNRFYDDLTSLQGYKNTWYTGSAIVSDHSAALWNFTEHELLPQLTA